MRVRLRIPKTQVRIVAVAAVVVALGAGAGIAAQGVKGTSEPSIGVVDVLPHDAAATFEQHPETVLAATVARIEPPQVPQGLDTPQDGEQEQGQSEQSQQQQADATQAQDPPAGQTGDPMLTSAELEALALVEQIIRDEEGVLMGTGFDYDAGGRRDPFSSLIPTGSIAAPTTRPFGLQGFLISEVELKAIAQVRGAHHAMVIGPNRRAYFLEVGTQLYDGHVVNIQANEVLFEQQVPDITGARRTRQVSKRLRTTDSGGG